MSRSWAPVALWTLYLAVLAGVLVAWTADPLAKLLLAAAAAGSGSIAAYVAVSRRRRGTAAPTEVEAVPDYSLAPLVGAIGIAAVVLAAEVGVWLALIGAGILAFAAFAVARELRTTRRERR